MLGRRELRRWVDHFGVPDGQVLRDHLISHVLHVLPEVAPQAVFFGGTALCRTHLPGWRLSEDIDLLAERPARTARKLAQTLPDLLRRDFPDLDLTWDRRDHLFVGLLTADDLVVRIQLVSQDDSYRRYPTARMAVGLRYEDLPGSVDLACPTAVGSTAMKLAAWSERKAPRDLCDLYGMATSRLLTVEALETAARAARPIQRRDFDEDQLPSEDAWASALGNQMSSVPDRRAALAEVRTTLASFAGWG